MDGGFSVEIVRCESEWTVRPRGELDLATAPVLAQALRSAHGGGAPRIVLDLDGLSFMASDGIELAAEAHARARLEGRRLVVRGGTPATRRVLALTGMDRVLDTRG